MAIQAVEIPGAVFIVWGEPTKLDADHLLDLLRRARERSGRPVLYVTRVPDGAPPPEPDVRRHISKLLPTFISYCSSYHVVLEGTGFMSALKRGILVSLFQICRRRNMFFVHECCDEVEHCVDETQRATVRSLLQRATALGLVDKQPMISTLPQAQTKFRRAG